MTINKKTPSAPSLVTPRPLRLRIDSQPEEVRVEIVPLIDVVFCILIFFILAAVSLARQQAIKAISVDLPSASTGRTPERQILVVSINELGQVYLEQELVVSREQFKQKLLDYRQQNPQGIMALYAAASASYNDVVQVLDLLREVGGDRVALATLPTNQPGATPSPTPIPSPTTGVPGFTPSPGINPNNPYGTQAPATPFDPNQPQFPGLPGTSPTLPSPSPGQPGVSPGGTVVPPNNNASPDNLAVPSPGATVSP